MIPNASTARAVGNSYAAWLRRHGLTAYAAAPIVGLSSSQSHRIANGSQAVVPTLARLLELLDKYGIPDHWRARDP